MTLAEFQHRVSLLQHNRLLTEHERKLVKTHTRRIRNKDLARDSRVREKERFEALKRRVQALESQNYQLKGVNELLHYQLFKAGHCITFNPSPLILTNSTYSESAVPYIEEDDAS